MDGTIFTGLTGLLVFLESFGGIFYISRRNKRQLESIERENISDELLSRFVVDGTENKIGESIAIDNDILIIKTEKSYLGVPLKHVEDTGDVLKVKGLVNTDKAEILGERWRERYLKQRE